MIIRIMIDPIYGYMFLLQNWWSGMEFVEVSAQYLAQCKNPVVFVTKKPKTIPRANQQVGIKRVSRRTSEDSNSSGMINFILRY